MSDPVKRDATYDDLVDLPEHVVGEIIAGDLYVWPRPRLGHAWTANVLSGRLLFGVGRPVGVGGPGDAPEGWWIVGEPELHLGADVLVPDIAGWRRARMPAFPSDAAFVELAPDWACEILSPSTARHDRVRKLPVYASAGVGHVWLIDPAARALEVFVCEPAGILLAGAYAGDARIKAAPFGTLELDLAEWWAPA